MEQPAWVRSLITELVSLPAIRLVLVIEDASQGPARPSFRQRLAAYQRSLLYLAYTRLDAWRFKPRTDPFEQCDLSDLLGAVPRLRVVPRKTKFCDFFEPPDVERIRSYDLDVAIRLGFRILKGDALDIARFGVWSYHHADNTVNRGGPPGFWEVAEGNPVTGVMLQVLSEDLDNGRVIARSFSATNQYSIAKNLSSYYWKSAALLPRKLRELYDLGPNCLDDSGTNGFTAYSKRLYKQPTNAEMLRILPRVAGRYVREKIRAIGARDQWFLAYKFRSPGTGRPNVPDGTFYNFRVISPPDDRFWADPFPVVRDGRYYVFFEEYPYATAKGRISVIELTRTGPVGPAQIALETSHHMSYPNVFEWRGDLYMLPEAVESGRVQTYRCSGFPTAWEPAGAPLEGIAGADPTLAQIGDRWWLFLTLAAPGTDCWDDELHLYHADSPLGPWKPHARNPVKSDVRSARPAGRIFSDRGEFYRPSQDCSLRYGYGIAIQRITRLDENVFEETPVAAIRPEWWPGLRATHTLNAVGDLTVIDGQWRRGFLSRRTFAGAAAHGQPTAL
jgi:hypothetical protein